MNEKTWIEQSLHQQGIKIIGEIAETHVRPWSTVFRTPTDSGDVYFKTVGPAFAFEVPLTNALYRLRPDCVPQVFAVDKKCGWMLMADGGQTLRLAFKDRLDRQAWDEVLALYAGLQIDLAGYVDELLAMGVRDRRMENLWSAYQFVRRLWSLSTAVKYKTQMRHIESMREEFATAVPGLLQEFLDAE